MPVERNYKRIAPLIPGVPGGIGRGNWTPYGYPGSAALEAALPASAALPQVNIPPQPNAGAPAPPTLALPQPGAAALPTPAATQRTYDSMRYCTPRVIPFQFTGPGNQLVLAAPPGGSRRVYLALTNDLTTGTMRFNYDTAAGAALGQPITPGGTAWFDVIVPQTNIYVYSPGIGQLTIAVANLVVPRGI